MKRLLLLLGVALALGACGDPPKVLQGSVLSFDERTQLLIVRDELPPNAERQLSLAGAELGADPMAGDTVRIAYYEKEGRSVATRVMNISRQVDVGGGGH